MGLETDSGSFSDVPRAQSPGSHAELPLDNEGGEDRVTQVAGDSRNGSEENYKTQWW